MIVSSCGLLSDNLSKEQIFTLVIKNEKLLKNAVKEIKCSKITQVSTTKKSEITSTDMDYSNIKGLYISTEENGEKIYKQSDNSTFQSIMDIKGLIDVNVEDEIIDFYCGGSGFGSSTSYYGFYYTENDNLSAIWCAGDTLAPSGKGWSWKNGDNSYYTEKITDNFYYYEAHF